MTIYDDMISYPPENQHIPPQIIFESMIFLFPFGGICDRSLEGIFIFTDNRNDALLKSTFEVSSTLVMSSWGTFYKENSMASSLKKGRSRNF